MKAFCHVTGGGLIENLPRALSEGMAIQLDALKWTVPAVFGWLSYKVSVVHVVTVVHVHIIHVDNDKGMHFKKKNQTMILALVSLI